jgi:F-box-like
MWHVGQTTTGAGETYDAFYTPKASEPNQAVPNVIKWQAQTNAPTKVAHQEKSPGLRLMTNQLQAQIHSLEQRNTYTASFLVPIHRLPIEMLAEIFLLSVCCHARSPLKLMRVCRSWRAIISAMPNIWANLHLSTWTELDKVLFVLKRTGESLLNVEIDTAADGCEVMRGTRKYSGITLAANEAKRWRNLIITSFPPKVDIDMTPEVPAFMFDGPMNALESVRIKNPCENSVAFDQLLDIVGGSSHSKLTDMELMSLNAIVRFSQPKFTSIFRRLVTFKVAVRNMSFEADILPHFERLMVIEAYGLRLPSYPADMDLPVVRTLKTIKLKVVSIEWMTGREFPMVIECALTWPRQIEALSKGMSLPVCTSFTYQGRRPYLLSYASLPQLTTLVVGNSVWNPRQGSEELIVPRVESTENFGCQWTKLRTLHLDSQCRDKSLIITLSLLPTLEELILGITRPSALRRKFFTALIASKSELSNGTSWGVSLCPNLLILGLRYRRWFRRSEMDHITNILPRIIDSRKRSSIPLRSLRIWRSMDDMEGTEMCKDTRGENGKSRSRV